MALLLLFRVFIRRYEVLCSIHLSHLLSHLTFNTDLLVDRVASAPFGTTDYEENNSYIDTEEVASLAKEIERKVWYVERLSVDGKIASFLLSLLSLLLIAVCLGQNEPVTILDLCPLIIHFLFYASHSMMCSTIIPAKVNATFSITLVEDHLSWNSVFAFDWYGWRGGS